MSAVEGVATMDAASAVKSISSRRPAYCSTSNRSMSVISGAGIGASMTVVTRMAVERSAMVTMEPRTGANKDPAGEPLRPVVTVGRAGVGVIVVVTVGAHRSGADPGWPNANGNANANGCRFRGRRRHQSNSEQTDQH